MHHMFERVQAAAAAASAADSMAQSTDGKATAHVARMLAHELAGLPTRDEMETMVLQESLDRLKGWQSAATQHEQLQDAVRKHVARQTTCNKILDKNIKECDEAVRESEADLKRVDKELGALVTSVEHLAVSHAVLKDEMGRTNARVRRMEDIFELILKTHHDTIAQGKAAAAAAATAAAAGDQAQASAESDASTAARSARSSSL